MSLSRTDPFETANDFEPGKPWECASCRREFGGIVERYMCGGVSIQHDHSTPTVEIHHGGQELLYCQHCAESGRVPQPDQFDDDELPENVIQPVELLTFRALWDANWTITMGFLLFAAGLGILCARWRG